MPVFQLVKKFRFEASHRLVYHDGKCSRLHGHSWTGAIIVRSSEPLVESGAQQGMLIDFGRLGQMADALEEELDHRHLNDIVCAVAPTSEVVARWCHQLILRDFAHIMDFIGPDAKLSVLIGETCTSECLYEA